MEIFEPKYDVGTDSWVLELKQKAPYFCYTTPSTSSSSIGSSCSTTPPHPDWRNGVEMSRDSADGGAHPSFLKRRWRSIKGAVSRFWTCCSNPPMPLEEAHVASRDSASDAMQWPRPRHGVYYSEMPEEEREKKRKEVIAFCNYQWQRPETEELHHKEIIAEENAVEIEMEEDEISPPPPSKLKAELMQEHKNMKNNNKNENENANANANLDDSIVPTDIVYSFTGLCEPSDPNKIVIKKHEKRVHHRHHLEECTIEDQKLEKKLELLGLKVNQIKLDRHSLFRAVEDQLSIYSGRASRRHHGELREMAAKYMREHKSDFLPFFQSSSRRFEEYCRQVESGDAWGGRLELGALSHCLRRHIVLFSGNFHDLEIGKAYRSEGGSGSLDPSIMLSYHMHPFGLREHYNSVVPDV